MKKPYSKGDYVEFKVGKEIKKGFIKQWFIAADTNRFIKYMPAEYLFTISTKSGKEFSIFEKNIIRKLPILRDKNGRFSKMSTWEEFVTTLPNIVVPGGKNKGKTMSDLVKEKIRMELESVPNYTKALSSKKKDCTCFNCDKCAEQMREYYKQTGELKPKMGKNWGKIKDAEGNYHEFGSMVKTEGKKPSYIIKEKYISYKKDVITGEGINAYYISAIMEYLDEQFEKNK